MCTARRPRSKADVDTPGEARVPVRVAVDVLVRRSIVTEVAVAVAVADAGPQLEWADSDVDDLIREANHPSPVLTHLDEDLGRAPRYEIGEEIARRIRAPGRTRHQEDGGEKERS